MQVLCRCAYCPVIVRDLSTRAIFFVNSPYQMHCTSCTVNFLHHLRTPGPEQPGGHRGPPPRSASPRQACSPTWRGMNSTPNE